MINGRIPLWMSEVISLCDARGGKITSEEIANIAATAYRYDRGPTLVNALRRAKSIFIEVIGEQMGDRGKKVKVYRVSRRPAAVSKIETMAGLPAVAHVSGAKAG